MGSLREVGPGWTVREFRELPEGTRCQLIEGELVMSPAPRFFHQRIVLRLAHMILSFLDRNPGVGTVVVSPIDVYLTETDAYQPDVVFVVEGGRAAIREDGVHGAPALVIEVLSPTSGKHDLGRKKDVYEARGVEEYWVVDVENCQIYVFRFPEGEDYQSETIVREGNLTPLSFEAIAVPVERFFH